MLPTLYKKTSTGAVQYWTIETHDSTIYTRFGQIGGKQQQTMDLITEGKNVGKKNETSPQQQAEAEAQAKWEKQKKKGYVETQEGAAAGELDALIEGGIVPMLAHKFRDHAHKVKYPALVQPKLDGIRCIAITKDGKTELWSRTRKRITSMIHIEEAVSALYGPGESGVLDGELYNHEYRSNFEQIVSYVRQETPTQGCTAVQYHIYDNIIAGLTFEERYSRLLNLLPEVDAFLKPVVTLLTLTEEEVLEHMNYFRSQGYEGVMVRNIDSLYVNKRSYDLQKVKEFDDAEFEIVGIEEGRGKLQGHVGSFICKTAEGQKFMAKMEGNLGALKAMFERHELWRGQKLTVRYQGITNKEKVPRFPVGVAVRNYE